MSCHRVAMGIIACALVASGCVRSDTASTTVPATVGTRSGDVATATSTPVEIGPGELPFDPVVEHLDANGVLTLDGALALFAATYAPLPDIEPASAPVEDDHSILTTLVSHRGELTAEQQVIIDLVIGVPGRTVFQPIRSSGHRGRPALGELAEPIIDEARAYFADRLGRSLTIPITIADLPMYGPGGIAHFPSTDVAARATGYSSSPTGELDECLIQFNLDAVYDPGAFASQVAHEVFHCFQYTTGVGRPQWVLEGQAAYAGEEYAGGTNASRTWWPAWIRDPHRPLTERSYDAIGLYSLSAALGADPYAYFDALYATPDLSVVRAATGPALDDAWALHLANDAAWGDRYVVTGPGAPPVRGNRYNINLTLDGPPGTFSYRPGIRELGAQIYQFDAPGDIVSVASNGATGGVRFRDGTEALFSAGTTTDFCIAPGGCVCPGDPPGPTVDVAGSSAFVGVGPSPGAEPIIRAISLDEWCGESASAPTVAAPTPDTCEIGTWISTSLVVPPVPGFTTVTSGGDGVVVTFGADGSFYADYDAMTPAVSQATIPDGPSASTAVTFTGALVGTWIVGADGQLVVEANGNPVGVVADLTVAGSTNRILDTTLAELAGIGGAAATFTVSLCEGSTLEVSSAYPGGSVTMVLERA